MAGSWDLYTTQPMNTTRNRISEVISVARSRLTSARRSSLWRQAYQPDSPPRAASSKIAVAWALGAALSTLSTQSR